MNNKPLVTVLFVCFNQERYVADALNAILCQDYENLEVLIFDDCSTDQSAKIVSEVVESYEGPHSIHVDDSDRNRGLVPNLNRAFPRCRGELVVMAAGDDVSQKDRVSRLTEAWLANGRPPIVTSIFSVIDKNGTKLVDQPRLRQLPFALENREESLVASEDLIREISAGDFPCVMGAAAAYSRELLQRVPKLPDHLIYEDRLLCFMGAITGGIVFLDSDLISYRILSNSLSSRTPGLKLSFASFRDRIRLFRASSSKFRVAYESMLAELTKADLSDHMDEAEISQVESAIRREIDRFHRHENWWSMSIPVRIKFLKEGPYRGGVTKYLNLLPLGFFIKQN